MGTKTDHVQTLKQLGCFGEKISDLMFDFLSKKPESMTYTAYAHRHGVPQATVSYWVRKLNFQGAQRRVVSKETETGITNINERLRELGYGDGNSSIIAGIAKFIYDEITVGKASVASCARKLRVDEETVEFYIQRASEVPRFAALIRTGSEEIKKNENILTASRPQHELIGARSTLQMNSDFER
jgi:hypothetical protein